MQTFKTIILSLGLLASTPVFAAGDQPRRVTTEGLKALGFSPAAGAGRINGKDMDVLVLPGSSLGELSAKLDGQFSVQDLREGNQRTLFVVDARSSKCPQCFKYSADKASMMADVAYAFSAIDLPDGTSLVMGTPFGPMARGLAARPQNYEGSALPFLPEGSTLELELGFRFAESLVDTSTIALRVAPALARSLFVEGLAKAGFLPLETPSESTSAGVPLAFQRGKTVVHLLVTAGNTGSETKVTLHETTVP